MVLGGLFFIALGLFSIFISIDGITSTHTQYHTWLTHQAPVLVQDTGISFFYLAFPWIASLLWIGGSAVLKGVRRAEDTPRRRRHMKIAGYLAVIGVITMLGGRYAGNWYWSETFRDAEYDSCPESFSITMEWAQTVWVRDPALCEDDDVLRMFSSYEDLDRINNHLRNRSSGD